MTKEKKLVEFKFQLKQKVLNVMEEACLEAGTANPELTAKEVIDASTEAIGELTLLCIEKSAKFDYTSC